MSSSDRMLIPACTCGSELQLFAPRPMPAEDVTHMRVYRCRDCGHETRIIVWGADVCEAYTPLAPARHAPAHEM
jgi:lipopolysaccharide biosynthesis regulator YciM